MQTAQLEDLLAHARWVEGFARMLVRDGADDLAQDAWLAAIRTPPAAGTRPRAWFATVLRNLARMRHRSDSRRAARELREGGDASTPDANDAVARMQLQRRLAELVLALDEPRRTVVVLAFYEGKSAAEIGRQLDVPATTVRSRIGSALETIRTQLDRDAGGDRSQWQLALAPLVGAPVPATGTLVPVFVVAAIAAVAVAVILAWPDDPPRSPPPAGPPAVAVSAATPELPPPAASTPDAAPAIVDVSRPATVPAQTAAARSAAPAPATAGPTPKQIAAEQQAFERTGRTLRARIDECWRIAMAAGREIKGTVAATITVQTQPDIDASLAFEQDNTVTDPQMLECLRENPLAIVEHVEELRAADPTYPGPITITLKHPLPPADDSSMPPDWPADDARPDCPSGTALAGTFRKLQWCQRADGTKHGPQHEWDAAGRLIAVVLFEEGKRKLATRRDTSGDR